MNATLWNQWRIQIKNGRLTFDASIFDVQDPRDQPEEAGHAAADLCGQGRPRQDPAGRQDLHPRPRGLPDHQGITASW